MTKRDDLLTALATLINGLAVPVSIGVPLGRARDAYTEVRDLINDFGYSSVPAIEARLREVLDQSVGMVPSVPKKDCTHDGKGVMHSHMLFEPYETARCMACGGEFTCLEPSHLPVPR